MDKLVFIIFAILFAYDLYMYTFKKEVIREYDNMKRFFFYMSFIMSTIVTIIGLVMLFVVAFIL